MVAGVLGVWMAPPLRELTCSGRIAGDSVILLVSVGLFLVESLVDDVPGVSGGEVDAAASGGGPSVAPGGGWIMRIHGIGIIGWLGVAGDGCGGC